MSIELRNPIYEQRRRLRIADHTVARHVGSTASQGGEQGIEDLARLLPKGRSNSASLTKNRLSFST
jgi:hypothetical protein